MFLDQCSSEKDRRSPLECLEDSESTCSSTPIKYGKNRSEGSVLDYYQVTRLLGGSQQSGVYQARRKTRLGEESDEGFWGRRMRGGDEVFLLKYLRINVLDEERSESLRDFFEQLDKVKELRHRNIVRMHEYFERYGKVYMIMDYCTGGNVASRLPYSETESAKLVFNILSAVKAVHASGLLHQSINLENIMFPDDDPKRLDIRLADFGLARKLDRRAVSCDEKNYACAPETFEGIFYAQSDVWSVGVLCFILLSRKAPFGGRNMVEQIKRCRYSFDDPVWARVSSNAKDFISSCLELNPSDRLTIGQALKHRWFAPKVSLSVSPIVSISEVETQLYNNATNGAKFKLRAINVMAEVSSMEEIINIAQWTFHDDTEKTGMTTYGKMKVSLLSNGYTAHQVDDIYTGCSMSPEDELEFRDFLAAALEARGRFEEIIITETFERSFPDENSFISKYEVAGLLTSVGAPERVDDFFPERHWEEVELVTFKDFLNAYHLKTREFSAKIAVSSAFSITMVATVNSLTVLPSDSLSPGVKYEKYAIVGASEVAAVYAVRVDPESEDDENGQTRRGIFGFQRRQVRVKAGKDYVMKAFQGTTPDAEYKIRKELQTLKELSHKNVVQVYDTFEEYGQIHIVMDLCTGDNLASRLPYTEREAAEIVAKLLSAVKHMHDLGITHSALSLETVLFKSENADSEINIVNFGLARKYLVCSRSEENDESLYAASPESFRGVHAKKGDIWSIGVIAYYLLSGQKPFSGKQWQEELQRGAFDFTSTGWQNVSGTAKTFVGSMLQLDMQKRPGAAKALGFRWFARNLIILRSLSRSATSDEDSDAGSCVRGESFRRVALNVMAQRLADEQIIELIKDCAEGEKIANTQTTSCIDFKIMLVEESYGYVVDEITEKCEHLDRQERFSASELLNATLAARGFVLQDVYRMELMTGRGGDGMVTRACLSRTLERTGACVGVDLVFDEVGIGVDAEEIAFEEFLRTFRELRTRVITSRLDSGMVLMTAVLSAAREITHHDSHDIVNLTRSKAQEKNGSTGNLKSTARSDHNASTEEWGNELNCRLNLIARSLA